MVLGAQVSPKEKWHILSPYLKAYGDGCMSYSTLQPGLEHFVKENTGYIAYATFRHPILARQPVKVVLADPIADKQGYQGILEDFLDENRHSIFVQVTRSFAEVLDGHGLQVNHMGMETSVALTNFSLAGTPRQKLRQWCHKCEREGIRVDEKDISLTRIEDVREVSEGWLKRKGGHELTILTRPLAYEHEEDVRYFWASQDGRLKGISIFDPMYENGRVIGYYHNFDRIAQNAPHGTGVYAVVQAAMKFRDEGIRTLSLGMSPASGIRDDLRHSRMIAGVARLLHDHGNFIYPFKGNESHKNKYDGRRERIYFSSTSGNGIMCILALMKSLRLF